MNATAHFPDLDRSLAPLLHLGGLGQLLLGIVDTSVIPTPGGLDILTILLAAHSPALVATLWTHGRSRLGLGWIYHLPHRSKRRTRGLQKAI